MMVVRDGGSGLGRGGMVCEGIEGLVDVGGV